MFRYPKIQADLKRKGVLLIEGRVPWDRLKEEVN